MVEQTETVRERALREWGEVRTEEAVNAAREQTEATMRLLTGACDAALLLLNDGEPYEQSEDESVVDQAGAAGVSVVDTRPPDEWGKDGYVVLEVEDFWLIWSPGGGIRLSGACLCGGYTDHPLRLHTLADLGRALSEAVGRGDHVCPETDPAWEGTLTLSAAMAKSDDPSLVLLDAMENYVAAVVEARTRPDNVVPMLAEDRP